MALSLDKEAIMSKVANSSIAAATLAASLDALVEARIAARRRELAAAERTEARAPLRAIIRRMSLAHDCVSPGG
jgi:outer membrane murein-binding lipoprotein Lpp